MKDQDRIRVSSGEDLLAFIPHIVGYWPENSVVCIGMNGKMLRATMRLDLPPLDGVDAPAFARIIATQLASDPAADGVLLAFFASRDWVDPQDLPVSIVYGALVAAFAAQGLPVRDAWYVGGEHFRHIECANPDCCPWPGKTVQAIASSFVNAELVYRGSAVQENPRQQVPELTAATDLKFIKDVKRLMSANREALRERGLARNQLAITLSAWDHAVAHWPQLPDAAMVAYLIGSVANPPVRDAVMVSLAATAELALAGVLGLHFLDSDAPAVIAPASLSDDEQVLGEMVTIHDNSARALQRAASYFSDALVGGNPESSAMVPNWARLDLAEELLLFLARSSTGKSKAPELCMLGWIQWCKGRGSFAGSYLKEAQDCQPGYRLAQLLDRLLESGYIAPWAKNEQTAWHGRQQEGRREAA